MPTNNRQRRRRTTPATPAPAPQDNGARWAEAWSEYQADMGQTPRRERQRVIPGCGLPTAGVTPTPEPPAPATCTACNCQTGSVVTTGSNEDLCGDCYSERFTACTRCSSQVRVGYDYYSNDSRGPFCEGCYMSVYSHCSGCAGECEVGELRASPIRGDGSLYCTECFTARFTVCAGCERAMLYDEVAYTDSWDGDTYCANCSPCDEDDDEAEWEQGRRVEGRTFVNIGSKRRFGVELEISGCRRHGGLRGKTPFGAKYDGSLSSGKEFVSPVLQGDEGLEAVASLCAYGRDNDWTVDSSCGYHVHIDCGDLNDDQLKSVAVGYAATEGLWARFVSKKRAGNQYCEKLPYGVADIRSRNFRSILDMSESRYHWLNWQAYSRHQTVEVRLHSGTTNYDKIANWVKIHTRFVDALSSMTADAVYAALAGKTVEEQFVTIMALVNDKGELRDFYTKRAAKQKQPLQTEAFDQYIADENLSLAS